MSASLVRGTRRALILGVIPALAAARLGPTAGAQARRSVGSAGRWNEDRRHQDRLARVADRAAGWLARRTGTGVPVASASTIEPDRSWDRSWVGPMTGRCVWDGVPEQVRNRARVRAYATTDSRYLLDEQPLDTAGRFNFARSFAGAKSLEVVDPFEEVVLAEWAPATGLVRSYDVGTDDGRWGRTWTYDQSVALVAALARDDAPLAAELGRGLMRLQVTGRQDGAFVVNAAGIDPEGADHEHRTGSSAWATYALLEWARSLPPGRDRRQALAAATRGSAWLIDQQVRKGKRAGLVTGGRGEWRQGRLVTDVRVTWAATEHALDCWQAWNLAARTLPDRADRRRARRAREAVERGLLRRMWLPGPGRFRRGYGPDGPDDAHPLDAASWGTLMLHTAGRHRMAERTLAQTRRFASEHGGVRGHRPYHRQRAFPRPPQVVWVEGTSGVALAEAVTGRRRRARQTLLELAPLQRADGSFPYATAADTMTGMDQAPSVAATAWWVMAAAAATG